MTCPECFYDRWDGKSAHVFGGRDSTKLTCFGPKAWRNKIPTKTLSEALPKAQADMQARALKQDSKAPPVLKAFDDAKAALGRTPTIAEIPTPKKKRAALALEALDLLERSGALVKASTLPKPSDRQSAGTRAQSASGHGSKGNRRTAGRGTDRR